MGGGLGTYRSLKCEIQGGEISDGYKSWAHAGWIYSKTRSSKLKVVKFYLFYWTIKLPVKINSRRAETHQHVKEDRMFSAGVADACCLHSHLAITLRCSSHAIGQMSDHLWVGCSYMSTHPSLGAYYVSIYHYKHTGLFTRVYSKGKINGRAMES